MNSSSFNQAPGGTDQQAGRIVTIVPADQLRYFQHDPPWVKLSALFISCLGRILFGAACVGAAIYKFLP